MLNGLDLFSGIGGISYALRDYIRPIAYCEIDPYCQGVLLSRIRTGDLGFAPIWDDINTLESGFLDRFIDIIYGGFPCQDISIAGRGAGLAGERSGLYWEIRRLAVETKAPLIFLENVPAITTRGGSQIQASLIEIGYDTRWSIFSASKFVDQQRERWFCLAKLDGERCCEGSSETIQQIRKTIEHEESSNYKLQNMERWEAYARNMRKNNGISNKVDRTRALGNAVVPQQTKEAFEILMGLKR